MPQSIVAYFLEVACAYLLTVSLVIFFNIVGFALKKKKINESVRTKST